jgi:hypothetical protein
MKMAVCVAMRGFSGAFASEVSLPVRVRYAVDSEGHVELTEITLPSECAALLSPPSRLLWPRLPTRELAALECEAAAEARRILEEIRDEPE